MVKTKQDRVCMEVIGTQELYKQAGNLAKEIKTSSTS